MSSLEPNVANSQRLTNASAPLMHPLPPRTCGDETCAGDGSVDEA